MWILNWLPDSLFHFVVLAGTMGLIASFVLGFIPFIRQYKLAIQVFSFLTLLFGMFMEGAISNQAYWEAKVKEAQLLVAKKETQSAEKTVEVVTKYVDRVRKVKEKSDVIIREVPKYITKEVDSGCNIPDSIRMLHNRASRNEVPETAGSSDATSTSDTGTTAGK